MTRQVESRLETCASLVDDGMGLMIPSYQRPYVWPVDDVIQLLEDIANAWKAGEAHYYIGTIITARAGVAGDPAARGQYELIDGQQRITTLMLLALAIDAALRGSRLHAFPRLGRLPRLAFAIREHVQAFLGHACGLPDHPPPNAACLANDYVIHLARALDAARQAIDAMATREDDGLHAFAEFFFTRVTWVNNIMPEGMNLNRLFAKINTSGLQLEQSDILKAQLLRKISRSRTRYDLMWQACENMSNYFERNVRKLFPDAPWHTLHYRELARFDERLLGADTSDLDGKTTDAWMSIDELAGQPAPAPDPGTKSTPDRRADDAREEDGDQIYCRSIITFAQLLMHALRIHLARRAGAEDIPSRLHVARFSDCFRHFVAHASQSEASAFIECLWEVRYHFDRWVVKWVSTDGEDEERLRLSSVHDSTSNGTRRFVRHFPDAPDHLTQLQAVRYFTGERTAQYWLTPLLGLLAREQDADRARALELLEHIDDTLSIATCTQKEASFGLLTGAAIARESIDTVCARLANDAQGTRFEHYWFQKLEYILWKSQPLPGFDEEKLKRFRITSKNSVEHVHPRRHEYREALEHHLLDAFGNLVLLSPGENSSYSNQDPEKKRVDFHKKPVYDSLKLAHIFHVMGKGAWTPAGIASHQERMIAHIRSHYAR